MLRRLPLLLVLITAALVLTIALGRARLPGGSSAAAHYNLGGQGPVVVLVHGLGSSVDHWLPTARRLGRTHRVVLVELPGHGQSAMPMPFTLDRATDALEGAVAAASSEPVVLVGHSLGGVVAANLARRDPSRVKALVLVETALKPQFSPAERAELRAALRKNYGQVLGEIYASFGRDSLQGVALAAEARTFDRRMMRAWIDLALDTDLSRAAGDITAPSLAVVSDRTWPHDEAWSVTEHALGYEKLHGLEVVRLDDCGHFLMIDQPAQLATAIERFIAPRTGPIALN